MLEKILRKLFPKSWAETDAYCAEMNRIRDIFVFQTVCLDAELDYFESLTLDEKIKYVEEWTQIQR